MIRFFILAACLAVLFPLAVNFFYHHGWIPALPSFLYETTFLVFFTTVLIYYYLSRSKNQSFFVQLYLLSMVVKLIAFFAYNLIVIRDDGQGAVLNVLYFLVSYIIFTAVEIGFLYKKISGKSKP